MSEVWRLSQGLKNRVFSEELRVDPSSRITTLEKECDDLRSRLDQAEKLRYEKWEMLIVALRERDQLRTEIASLELRVRELESCLEWAGSEVASLAIMLKEP